MCAGEHRGDRLGAQCTILHVAGWREGGKGKEGGGGGGWWGGGVDGGRLRWRGEAGVRGTESMGGRLREWKGGGMEGWRGGGGGEADDKR